jgi:hypothetical protein
MTQWQKLMIMLFKRKHMFIDRPQQFKFGLDLCMHALLFPMILLTVFFVEPFPSWFIKGGGAESRQVVASFMSLCLENWWVVLFAISSLAIMSVLFSNKIFGPIYRCSRNVEKVMEGDKHTSFKLRSGDYFEEFAELLGTCFDPDSVNSEPPTEEKAEQQQEAGA